MESGVKDWRFDNCELLSSLRGDILLAVHRIWLCVLKDEECEPSLIFFSITKMYFFGSLVSE